MNTGKPPATGEIPPSVADTESAPFAVKALDIAVGPAMARVGMTLGRYQLTGILGHGAMATVFRARDTQLGRTVAVKVMSLAMAARAESTERFKREAHAAAKLKHPGIVEIHDFVAATADEPSYMVVELIDGPTLGALLDKRRGRLLPEVAALVGARICDALAVAHQSGVVHRDIKPDNVMLERTDDGARVVIADFGVAQVTGLETMTATGALVGSPAYMSPEQTRGGDVGPKADLWALGVLLYQMSTGALPFTGKDPIAVITAIARSSFRRPSQLCAAVAPEFERIALRCLKSAQADRYDDAREIARDLRALVADAGLTDERESLRLFLDDPDGFEATLRPRVAAQAVERARRHIRRGEFGRALAEVGRITEYVPGHPAAKTLLRSITARRRWVKAALLASAIIVATGLGFGITTLVTRGMAPPPTPIAKPSPVAEPRAVETSPAPIPLPPAPPAVAQDLKPDRKSPKRDPRAPPAPALPQPAAEKEVPTPNSSPIAVAVPSPIPAETPPSARLKLQSQRGFCNPTIDDQPVTAATMREFETTPGRHRVYCALSANSPKLLVGEVDLAAGGKVVKVIRTGPDEDKSRPRF